MICTLVQGHHEEASTADFLALLHQRFQPALRAEAQRLRLDLIVESAGTGNWHVGDPPDPRAQAVARKHGIDTSSYQGRQVTPADFRRFTHVIALDHDLDNLHRIASADATAELSLLLDHVPGRKGQAVADPYFGDDAGFEVTWAEATTAARGLVAKL